MAEEGSSGSEQKKATKRFHRPAPSAASAFCCGLLVLIVLAGITALVLYLVYRPSKPRFTVIGVAVYDLNVTSPDTPAVSTTMQFTLAIRNPSGRSSILYDRLVSYVMYRGQAITPTVPLPPLFQEKDSTVAVSPVLGGGVLVPVSAEVARGLSADQGYGLVPVRLVVLGRLKYKAGPFRSAWDGFFVRCDLLVGVKKGSQGQVPLLGAADCSVNT
uniref:Putative syntaxin-24 n=1 Tax=Anthurium amnicola TaxID=1678845 RepID=A0A1D1Z9U9_9ARAE